MAAPKRSKAQAEADRAKVARFYCQGLIQNDIAIQVGITRSMVAYDLKIIRRQWLESSLVNYSEAKARELAKIDNLELVYWESWEKSWQEMTSRTVKTINAATVEERQEAAKNALLIAKTEQRLGDPRFLAGVQWCIDKRCKILNLDAPTKIQFGWEKEVMDLYRTGVITEQDIVDELGTDVAQEFFKQAGVTFAGIRESSAQGEQEK